MNGDRVSQIAVGLLLIWAAGCGDGRLYPLPGVGGLSDSNTGPPSGISTASALVDTGNETGLEPETESVSTPSTDSGIDSGTLVIESHGGEAEAFDFIDNKSGARTWVLVSTDSDPGITPDGDGAFHANTATGSAYMEVLPDLHWRDFADTETDTLSDGKELIDNPANSPSLGYKVTLENSGRYYVWARAWSTGGKDNSCHVGVDGDWPDSGLRIQFPSNTGGWVWSSNQRNTGGKVLGEPNTIWLDIASSGDHVIYFAMREDGFELDSWIITTDPDFVPAK